MAEMIQEQVGVGRGSTVVLSAIAEWLDCVHPGKVISRVFRLVRGNPETYNTMMGKVIEENCKTHMDWDNYTSWFSNPCRVRS